MNEARGKKMKGQKRPQSIGDVTLEKLEMWEKYFRTIFEQADEVTSKGAVPLVYEAMSNIMSIIIDLEDTLYSDYGDFLGWTPE